MRTLPVVAADSHKRDLGNFEKSQVVSVKVNKVGDVGRGWPEGSLFDSYYTKV